MFASFISPELIFQAQLLQATPLMVISAASVAVGGALLTSSVRAMLQVELELPERMLAELSDLRPMMQREEAPTLY